MKVKVIRPRRRLMTSQASRLVLLLSAVVACSGERPQAAVAQAKPTCGAERIVTGAGVGDFRIGLTVEEIGARCDVVKDTILPFAAEGDPERRLSVRLDGDTVHATVVNGRIWRIEVRSRRFRTSDSIGVGSSLLELKRQPVEYYGYGEGGPFVGLPRHCGLSLELDGVPGVARTLEQVPNSATVGRILILGC